jgi:hypothetical protein
MCIDARHGPGIGQTAFVQGYNCGLWKGVLAAAGLVVNVAGGL